MTLGGRTVVLYPLFHPAAALYTPTMLETLERDVSRLPELLAAGDPRVELRELGVPVGIGLPEGVRSTESRRPVQLGLF